MSTMLGTVRTDGRMLREYGCAIPPGAEVTAKTLLDKVVLDNPGVEWYLDPDVLQDPYGNWYWYGQAWATRGEINLQPLTEYLRPNG